MVTGRPRMISKSSMKSARCMGRSCSSAARRSASVSARIISRITVIRSAGKNMCSLRQRPMPSALNSRAMRASAGVSALARTPRSRTASAQSSSSEKAPPSSGGIICGAPTMTSPRVPSRVIERAFAEDAAVGGGHGAVGGVEAKVAGADHAGNAKTARYHRGMAGHSAADGQDAEGGVHAADVLGAGLGAHEDGGLAAGGGGLGGLGGEDDAAGGGARAGGEAGGADVARGGGVDLRVQVLDQAARLDAQQRLVAGDGAGVRQVDGDAHGGAAGAADGHGVEDGGPAALDGELDEVGVAERPGGGGGGGFELGQRRGAELVERAGGRGGAGGGALRLRPEAAAALRGAGAAVDRLEVAGAAGAGAEAEREALDDEAEAGVGRRALGLAQDARRGAGPGAGHGAGGGLELGGGVGGPGLAGLLLENFQHISGLRGGVVRVAAEGGVEVLGVDPVHGVGEAGDEAAVEAEGGRGADALGETGDGRVGEADVEHGAGAAPGALLRAAAEREQGSGRQRGRQAGHRAAGGEGGDAGEGEGDARRDRQAEGGQARQVGGAAAVAVGADGVAGVEADDRAGQRADDLLRLHCSAA